MLNGISLRGRILLLAAAVVAAAGTLEASQNSFDRLARESLAQIEGTLDVPGLRADVQVLRDRWGIPHIYAQSELDM
ncbi:MAG: hypothetical protein ACRELT_06465, partial [Longimicrobiales bacterium]